jgi:hypothetical protein
MRKEARYIGREDMTDLMRVSFLALVSHCPPQDKILALNLLMISSHREALLEPKVKGSPKYFIFSQEA